MSLFLTAIKISSLEIECIFLSFQVDKIIYNLVPHRGLGSHQVEKLLYLTRFDFPVTHVAMGERQLLPAGGLQLSLVPLRSFGNLVKEFYLFLSARQEF